MMEIKPYPGFELFYEDVQAAINSGPIWRQPEGLEMEDRMVPGLPGQPEVKIRVYRQKGVKKAPVVIDLHSGGFVYGGVPMSNVRCSRFVMGLPCVGISVDYRLAPNRYPTQLDDCRAVLDYIQENADEIGADPEQIAVVGTSAGGTLAAGLCLWLRDHGGPKIALQILNYPMVLASSCAVSGWQIGDTTPLVQRSTLRQALEVYTGTPDGLPVPYYAAPGRAPDLSGLPPAFVVTCEYDPLRDEGLDYARRLMEHGVQTEIHSMPRVFHAYDEIDSPLRDWIYDGMKMALAREFGML